MAFARSKVDFTENDKVYKAKIIRRGDLTKGASVRCFTRQGTAKVQEDFQELKNTTDSIIYFAPNVKEAECAVIINPDGKWEDKDEAFKLKLDSPDTDLENVKAALAYPDELVLNIHDNADKPKIKFRYATYDVYKPEVEDLQKFVTVNVDRVGDSSKESKVRLFTEDALAKSGDGKDYLPVSKNLIFKKGESTKQVQIEILFNPEKSIRKSFWVRITPDEYQFADVNDMERAIVYVTDSDPQAAITFPVKPLVVSLKDYDKELTDDLLKQPIIAGYPVRFLGFWVLS